MVCWLRSKWWNAPSTIYQKNESNQEWIWKMVSSCHILKNTQMFHQSSNAPELKYDQEYNKFSFRIPYLLINNSHKKFPDNISVVLLVERAEYEKGYVVESRLAKVDTFHLFLPIGPMFDTIKSRGRWSAIPISSHQLSNVLQELNIELVFVEEGQ